MGVETVLLWTAAANKGGRRAWEIVKGAAFVFDEHAAHGGGGEDPHVPRLAAGDSKIIVVKGKGEAVQHRKRHCGCRETPRELADLVTRLQTD